MEATYKVVFSFFQLQAESSRDELSNAKSTARQDDILAVCKLHGFLGTPTVQNQLQALDREYQQLREQGQSSKADYVQTLYIWLSKKTGKVCFSLLTSDKQERERAKVHLYQIGRMINCELMHFQSLNISEH